MSTGSVGEPIDARLRVECTTRSPTRTRAVPASGTLTRKKWSNVPGVMRIPSPYVR